VLLDESISEPAFGGLVHPMLRHVAVCVASSPVGPVSNGCGLRLRQRHFPRLRRFTVDGDDYPVWVPWRAGRRK
jgi:hypothetical protein